MSASDNSERFKMDETELEKWEKILQERLEKDEHDWHAYEGWKLDEPEKLYQIIKGYFNCPDERVTNFEQRYNVLDLDTPIFIREMIELRNPDKQSGYVIFRDEDTKKGKLNHELSRKLTMRDYKELTRCVQKSFMDLEKGVSGFFWRTIRSTHDL